MSKVSARKRAHASIAVRKQRGDVYLRSYKRARRAIIEGFYLEAIVLVESMLADRLEALLARQSSEPLHFQTAAQAAAALRKSSAFIDADLLDQVSVWSQGRSRWVHEFAKVPTHDNLSWRGRLRDARDVAVAGFDLTTRVAVVVRKSLAMRPE